MSVLAGPSTPVVVPTPLVIPPKTETSYVTIIIIAIFLLGLVFFFIYWLSSPRRIKEYKRVKRRPKVASVEAVAATPVIDEVNETTVEPSQPADFDHETFG